MQVNYERTPISLPTPLSLYIHIPWCVRKCPYCDFNSHEQGGELPVDDYCSALIEDLKHDAWMAQGRSLGSIFFGGGTPSLLPNAAVARILDAVDRIVGIDASAEITLEANPGTVEHHNFRDLRASGINRLSLGVQSFDAHHLTRLGRIHNGDEAVQAVLRAQEAGFDNINIDLMHGLPQQNVDEALADLNQAIELKPRHISWYQLTIEKNTEFYSRPPPLPTEDHLADIYESGQQLLADQGFAQYEISAYARDKAQSQHNLNYWQFGDYLAIGAGAHGKISHSDENEIFRYHKTRLPKDYLDKNKAFTAAKQAIAPENLAIEFMMNALRLNDGVPSALFAERTGLPIASIEKNLEALERKGLLIELNSGRIAPSALGRRFLNNLLEAFFE